MRYCVPEVLEHGERRGESIASHGDEGLSIHNESYEPGDEAYTPRGPVQIRPARPVGLALPTGSRSMKPFTRDEIIAQLRALGIESGAVLLIHASFRAVRPIEGGPVGLIEALLAAIGPEGTLVMPSWTGDDETPFDPATTPASVDLGVVADTFWRMPGVVRSEHLFAFAAKGPQAHRITAGPLPLPPHSPQSPVCRVYELDGQVLLLGVGQDANTTLHLAELMANVPYRLPKYCTVLRDGRPVRIDYLENDHCCSGFALCDDWLRADGLQSEGLVGHAQSRLARSQDIVRVALERLRRDPLIFLHPESAGCEECNEARASVPRVRAE
jgi:aminoglycoside N3'-acetyltransferase